MTSIPDSTSGENLVLLSQNEQLVCYSQYVIFLHNYDATTYLGEMQRIAFRLMLSSCVSVCLCICVCIYAAFVDARKTV